MMNCFFLEAAVDGVDRNAEQDVDAYTETQERSSSPNQDGREAVFFDLSLSDEELCVDGNTRSAKDVNQGVVTTRGRSPSSSSSRHLLRPWPLPTVPEFRRGRVELQPFQC
ncbi:uncharacterized protein LOC133917375 [Phragmites australis]|uniref:uncharacterized protein LOC133917375 n=1 Tax=Phragmites australis TaxID=29695 RepID=UPI002D79F8B6|nr:uncharacterized protein LOC133917375 [Phragmites australis]